MYYCDKCGEKIHNLNEPCPTCGMYLNSNIVNNYVANNINNNVNDNNSKKFIFSKILIGCVIVSFIIGLFLIAFVSGVNTYNGINYSLRYDSSNWNEYTKTDGYFILQNKDNSIIFIQIPEEATELSINLDNEDMRNELYKEYLSIFNNSSNIEYTNITSSIKRFSNTDYYYLTVDYNNSYSINTKGRIYILMNSEGKCLNILLNLSNVNISYIEEEVYDILESIDM